MLRSIAFLTLAAHAAAEPDISCAVCGLSVQRLTTVLEATKKELELSKETNEKRAASIDKVQKAQTKRWLKNEYGVALRAGVEEEVEKLCSHDTLATSRELQRACQEFVEEHEEPLVRAVLDGKGDEMCAEAAPDCEGESLVGAIAAHKRERRSDPAPAKPWVGKGAAVRRLVGTTFSEFVMGERLDSAGEREVNHVLVMLYHSPPQVAKQRFCAKEGGACVAKPYKAAVAEFYQLAARLNKSSTAHISLGEMDLRGNELPQPTELADPSGLQFALYVDKDKARPKLAPAVGEPLLAGLELPALRNKLKQLAGNYLKAEARSEMTRALSPEPKQKAAGKKAKGEATPDAKGEAKGAATGEFDATQFEAAAAAAAKADGGGEEEAKPPPPPAPPRKKSAPRKKPKRGQAQAEGCEVCGLLVRELHEKLVATKRELEAAHTARRREAVEKVQKAQTKRWLKQEYSVALAAALEERVDGLCESTAWVDLACARNNSLPSWAADGGGAEQHCAFRRFLPPTEPKAPVPSDEPNPAEMAKNLKRQCSDTAKERCRTVVEDHIEPIMRAVLDSDMDGDADPSVCTQLFSGCEEERAACFAPKSDGAAAAEASAEVDEDAAAAAAAEAYFAESKEEL